MRPVLLASPLVLVAILVAGCGEGAVELPSYDVTAAERAACDSLVEELPAAFVGLEAREVTPSDATGAAWGDPAVELSCGGGMPDDFTPGASCEEVEGVGWYVPIDQFADLREDLTIFTIGREPVVRLDVPAEYRREAAFAADALVTLAEPVKTAIPDAEPCV